MTEYFRITGLHNINFDEGATGPFRLVHGSPPRGIDEVLSRQEIISLLPRFPEGIRGHCLSRGLSRITCDVNIQAGSDTLMEQYRQQITRTLVDAALYIETEGARGTRAVLRYKMNNAVNDSYKTVYWGELEEMGGRDILGTKVKEQLLTNMKLTLYCEGFWRPASATTLGPNQIYCPSFEEDGDANGRADDWTAMGAPVLTIENTIVLHGCNSQKVATNAANEGIVSTTIAAPAAPANDAVAYVWVCRPAAGTDIRARIRDTTAGADRATADLSAATTTAVGKSGQTWYRLELIATNNIVPANNHQLQVYSLAATVTDWYVDKAFLKWDTTTIPDEWCDHWLIYNHYDTTEGAAHEGHINYFDVDDLKGDVDARLLTRVEFEQAADRSAVRELIVGRRTRSDYCAFVWWLEAEDNWARSNWANLGGLARCSAGDCVSDAANAAGWIQWNSSVFAPPSEQQKGRFDVYGVVFTDDIDNTSYRLSYDLGVWSTRCYNNWVKQDRASDWQLIHLGEVDFSQYYRAGFLPVQFNIYLEYAKDAADLVRADVIWLIPKDEPEMNVDCMHQPSLSITAYWVIGREGDFDYVGHEQLALHLDMLHLRGDAMSLTPRLENRLYLSCISDHTTHREWEAHGASTDLLLIVNIDYLPQYVSPLE